jgi:hypothetical protein
MIGQCASLCCALRRRAEGQLPGAAGRQPHLRQGPHPVHLRAARRQWPRPHGVLRSLVHLGYTGLHHRRALNRSTAAFNKSLLVGRCFRSKLPAFVHRAARLAPEQRRWTLICTSGHGIYKRIWVCAGGAVQDARRRGHRPHRHPARLQGAAVARGRGRAAAGLRAAAQGVALHGLGGAICKRCDNVERIGSGSTRVL